MAFFNCHFDVVHFSFVNFPTQNPAAHGENENVPEENLAPEGNKDAQQQNANNEDMSALGNEFGIVDVEEIQGGPGNNKDQDAALVNEADVGGVAKVGIQVDGIEEAPVVLVDGLEVADADRKQNIAGGGLELVNVDAVGERIVQVAIKMDADAMNEENNIPPIALVTIPKEENLILGNHIILRNERVVKMYVQQKVINLGCGLQRKKVLKKPSGLLEGKREGAKSCANKISNSGN